MLDVIILPHWLYPSFPGIIPMAADFLGIASFVLSIALLLKSEKLRKTIEFQKREYQKGHTAIKRTMIALRRNLFEGSPLTLECVSEIRIQLYSFEHKFTHLLTHKDKKNIRITLNMLNNPPERINCVKLCNKLDYFIGRLERNEQ